MEPGLARASWRRLEAVHAVTYFAPECRDANKQLGLRGFWMGYFASRAAPLGAVSAGVVAAAFYNFHPAMVLRAIPGAWSIAAPDGIVSARSRAAAVALRRLIPEVDSPAAELLPLLTRAIDHADGAGRPIFSANRDVAGSVGSGTEAVWQAATTLREHRGDGHVAILTEAGLDGCEAHVLLAATEGVAPELLRDNRGWSVEDWDAATQRLHGRGLLTSEGRPTDAGRELRRRIERRTDELAARSYDALGDAEMDRLLELAALVADPITASGVIPFPNPMGLPKPR